MKTECSKNVTASLNGHEDSLSWFVLYQRSEGPQQITNRKNTSCEGSLLRRTCWTHGWKQAERLSLQPSERGETQSRVHQLLLWSLHGWIFSLVPCRLKESRGLCTLITISDIIPSVASRLALNEVHPWLPVRPDQSQQASSTQEAPLLRRDNRCALQCKLQQRSSSSNKGFFVH